VLGRLQSGNSTGVGDGDDHVHRKAGGIELTSDLLGEGVSHGHTRAVDRDSVEDRVRAGKIDVFENIGSERPRRNTVPGGDAISCDDHGLACQKSPRTCQLLLRPRGETAENRITWLDICPVGKS
jgi:hypothetical protein